MRKPYRKLAVALVLCAFAAGRYAWAQSTEAEQRSVPLVSGLLMVSYPTDISTDAGKAHLAGIYGGVFDGGGGGGEEALGSTGTTTAAPAGAALQILRRGR